MRGFADRKEQPHVTLRDAQAFAELRHIGRQQCHLEISERNADVGRADHFGGQGPDGLAQLHAEDGSAHVLQHGRGAPHHGLHFFRHLLGEGVRQGIGDAVGHRLSEPFPRGEGGFHPFSARPGAANEARCLKIGDGIQPKFREAERFVDFAGLQGIHRRIRAGGGNTAGVLVGKLPIDGALGSGAHHGLHLGEHLLQHIRVVRQPCGFCQFGGVDVAHALPAHQVLQHFCQGIHG